MVEKNEPISDVIHNVSMQFQKMIRSELNLARVEFKEGIRTALHDSVIGTGFLIFAILGIFPLMAFLVIGLGRLFRDNYWLSSLAVGLFMAAVGGFFAWKSLRKVRSHDLSFPHVRDSIDQQRDVVSEKILEVRSGIKENHSRRAA